MPRLPIDYSKTIIYKICCNDVNIIDIYIGSTTDLVRRRQAHKQNCNNESSKEYDCYKYKFIRENGGWDNWSIIPVEEYPCENINQALIRERYWIEELKASLNKIIPSRTNKEWHNDNKEKIKEYKKEQYENNKEKIKEQKKEYYENNKTIILEKQREKIECDCGGKYTLNHKARHLNSKKHQNYITSSPTIIETRQES